MAKKAKKTKASKPADKNANIKKAQAARQKQIREMNTKKVKRYSLAHGVVLALNIVLVLIAAIALVYATTKFGHYFYELRRPTIDEVNGFVSQIAVCVFALVAIVMVIINGIFGYKRSYRLIMWTIVATAVASLTYIGSEVYYGFGFGPLVVSAITLALVFAATQRLFNKRRTVGFLLAGLLFSILASALFTVHLSEYKDFTKYIKTDLWYVISTYVVIWTRTVLIGVTLCAYLARVYRKQRDAAQRSLDKNAAPAVPAKK